jgi:hypothetical protein
MSRGQAVQGFFFGLLVFLLLGLVGEIDRQDAEDAERFAASERPVILAGK